MAAKLLPARQHPGCSGQSQLPGEQASGIMQVTQKRMHAGRASSSSLPGSFWFCKGRPAHEEHMGQQRVSNNRLCRQDGCNGLQQYSTAASSNHRAATSNPCSVVRSPGRMHSCCKQRVCAAAQHLGKRTGRVALVAAASRATALAAEASRGVATKTSAHNCRPGNNPALTVAAAIQSNKGSQVSEKNRVDGHGGARACCARCAQRHQHPVRAVRKPGAVQVGASTECGC